MSEKKDHNELENPLLKSNPFVVPVGYFDTLHKNVISKVEDESDFQILDNKNLKENIFKTPTGYFEASSRRIIGVIQKENNTKVIPLYRTNLFRYAAAAAVLFVVLIFGIKSNNTTSEYEIANLSDEVIIEYLLDEEMSNLDILASVDEGINILSGLFEFELEDFGYPDYDNPEMEYDFEYIDY